MIKYIINLDEYRVIKQLGKGESGNVFLVEKISTKEQFAAKVSNKQCIKNQDQILFFSEIETLINTNNPAILKFIGFSLSDFHSEPFPTILTEYLSRGTLMDILDKSEHGNPPQEWTGTKKYINLLGIALGMKYLHSIQTVQRDLKPQNVLLDENLYPRIIDFGFSKKLDVFDSKNLMESTKGTPLYMAPEIITGSPYSYKVDVFSYSIIAYEIITSNSPIPEGENGMFYVYRVPNGKRPDISKLNDQIVIEFLQMCWSNDPNERPTFEQIVDIIKESKFASFFDVDADEVNKYIDLFQGEERIRMTNQKVNLNSESESTKNPEFNSANNLESESTKNTEFNSANNLESGSAKNPESESTKKKKRKFYSSEIPTFKLVLLGNIGSKKYELMNYFYDDLISFDSESVSGESIRVKEVRTEAGDVRLCIWDTPTQERFLFITKVYLNNADAVIICVNANIEDQYKSIPYWINFIKSYEVSQVKLIYIVATDCIDGCITDPEIIHQIANENGLPFFPVCFGDTEVHLILDEIAKDLVNTYDKVYKKDKDEKKICLIY